MNKRELYDGFDTLENEMRGTLDQLSKVKQALHDVIEKNTVLEMENQRLRDHIEELRKNSIEATEASKNSHLSKSRMNLEKLYEDGFHVCNILYGSRRENDEECAFCLEVIYGERNK